MKLIISKIKFGELEFPNSKDMMNDVLSVMKEKFAASKILYKANISNTKEDGAILMFSIVQGEEPKRLFLSEEKNIVSLKADDPRAKKLKRDHLLTSRLTKKQSDVVWNDCINGTLTKLGIACNISLQEFSDDLESLIILRDGMDWKEFPIKDKAFPQPKA